MSKKIGITFGGGAARGAAHIGVIKAFDEAKIKFDYVTGNSIGSMVGAFYASGVDWEDVLSYTKSLKRKDVLKRSQFHVCFDSQNIEDIAKKLIGDITFEELPIPLKIVAVDVRRGELISLSQGSVAKAVSASCAYPGVFSPVEMGDMLLVDGGILNSVPADFLSEMGAEYVVGVNLNHDRKNGIDSERYFDVISGSIKLMMSNNAEKGKKASDVFIQPTLDGFGYSKIERLDEMVEIGYQETKKYLEKIKKDLG